MTMQASLFPIEKPKTYGEIERERKHALCRSAEVKVDVLAVFQAHQGEWIWMNAELHAVREKHKLGSYFYGAIESLERDGLLERRHVYHGATSPVGAVSDLAGKRKLKKGEKPALPYLGYRVEHRAKVAA